MIRHARRRPAGFTLIETIVVVAVMGAILVSVVTFSLATQSSYEIVLSGAKTTADIRRPLDAMTADLRNSAPDRVTVDELAPDWDAVSFQVPVGWNGGGIVWGAEGEAGYRLEYRIEGVGRLVRRVLDDTGTPVDEITLARRVDTVREGVKGFDVEMDDDHCILTLRIRRAQGNKRIQRQASTTVVLRNAD